MFGDEDRSFNWIYLQLHTIGSKIYNKTSINPVKKNTTCTYTSAGGSWPLVVIMRDCSNTVDNCGIIGLSVKAKRLSLSRSSFLLASDSRSPSSSSYYHHHHHHHHISSSYHHYHHSHVTARHANTWLQPVAGKLATERLKISTSSSS